MTPAKAEKINYSIHFTNFFFLTTDIQQEKISS